MQKGSSNSEFSPSVVGDTDVRVRAKVANVDQRRTNDCNVLVVVFFIENSEFYRMGNSDGIYKQLFLGTNLWYAQ